MKFYNDKKALQNLISELQNQGKKFVFTNGCFDLLHIGHLSYLEEARKSGDFLIVAINSDASIKKINGEKRPIISEKNRAIFLEYLPFVDFIVTFHEETPLNLIKFLNPNILVKGGDWKIEQIVGSEFVLENGGEVKSLSFLEGFSSTDIISKILKVYGE